MMSDLSAILENVTSAPNANKSSLYRWCDYIEMRCITHLDHRFSRDNFAEAIGEAHDTPTDYVDDLSDMEEVEQDSDETNAGADLEEGLAANSFSQLRWRAGNCPSTPRHPSHRRVAINRAISAHRRLVAEVAALARLRLPTAVVDANLPPDDQIWSEVRRLPRRQGAAIVLWAVEGLSHNEIGQVLGCSAETARTHLRRARSRLQATLSKEISG